jgi:hypothetical protein
MLAFRSVVSVLLRALGDFLHTLKAGPAGGRLRRPSSTGKATTERPCLEVAFHQNAGNAPYLRHQPVCQAMGHLFGART